MHGQESQENSGHILGKLWSRHSSSQQARDGYLHGSQASAMTAVRGQGVVTTHVAMAVDVWVLRRRDRVVAGSLEVCTKTLRAQQHALPRVDILRDVVQVIHGCVDGRDVGVGICRAADVHKLDLVCIMIVAMEVDK